MPNLFGHAYTQHFKKVYVFDDSYNYLTYTAVCAAYSTTLSTLQYTNCAVP